ncbi:hypothetical protein LCGC14_1200090 [marine sediment metagenome]|uniref:Uncharacterized protein n=1 Tax=marine sediment metagenome TaxID=412755 RepID=A0A0F9LLT8_9ZZZZ
MKDCLMWSTDGKQITKKCKQIYELEAENAKLKEYAGHKYTCATQRQPIDSLKENDCDCGLDALKEE